MKGYLYHLNSTPIDYGTLFLVDKFSFKANKFGTTASLKYQLYQNGNEISNECYLNFVICAEGCKQGCNDNDYCSNHCTDGLYFIELVAGIEQKCVRKCPITHPFYAQYPGYIQCLEDCPSHGLYTYKDQCVSTCPEGTSPVQTDCIESTLNPNSRSISSSIESSANKTEWILIFPQVS